MTHLEKVEQDLRYVRSAIERSDTHRTPRLICFLWAALVFVGFALVDLRVAWVQTYWTFAGPGGFLLSGYLGWHHARHAGQPSARMGRRQMLHWGAMLACVYLMLLLPAFGSMDRESVGPAILLILALGYFQAGVHFDGTFRWIGLLLAVGYIFVLFVQVYAWITLGAVIALSLVTVGLRTAWRHEASA